MHFGAAGLDVRDEGDLPLQVWRPDRMSPRAQNVDQVTECVGNLIERLVPLLSSDQPLLVLGGNCTIALGVVAALRRITADPVGLLYVDRHYDNEHAREYDRRSAGLDGNGSRP